jgi:RNase P/RNase MRP subunit p29
LPSPDPHNKHSNIHYHFLLSLHITAARHANKTDCGVGVAVVDNTCCYIL